LAHSGCLFTTSIELMDWACASGAVDLSESLDMNADNCISKGEMQALFAALVEGLGGDAEEKIILEESLSQHFITHDKIPTSVVQEELDKLPGDKLQLTHSAMMKLEASAKPDVVLEALVDVDEDDCVTKEELQSFASCLTEAMKRWNPEGEAELSAGLSSLDELLGKLFQKHGSDDGKLSSALFKAALRRVPTEKLALAVAGLKKLQQSRQ